MTAILEHGDLLRELGTNLGLLSLLVLAYALLAPALQPDGRRWGWRELALGLAFGLAGVLAQLAPLTLEGGLKTDARGVMLALAGAYLPLPSALLALVLSAGFRLLMTQPLGWLGAVGMAMAVLLGWLWARWWSVWWTGRRWARPVWLMSLGLAVAAMGLVMAQLLPGDLGARLARSVGPALSLTFVLGTLGLGLLLDLVLAHRRNMLALRQALHERELSQAQLELALEASGAAQWEWQIEAQLMVLSDRFYRQLGYQPGAFEATVVQWRAMLHPEDVERAVSTALAAARSPVGTYVSEYRMRDVDGEWRWLLSRGRVVRRGQRGEPLLMVGSHLDIDVLRRQQAALLESHERFQQIYQTTPDAMGITRIADGLYLDVNEAFVQMTGYARDEVLGRTSTELGVWAEPRQRALLIESFRRDGLVDSMEMQVRRRDGRLLEGLMSVRLLRQHGEDCMLFIYRDITERQRLLRDAEAARAETAAAAAANLAKTEFLSRMSHELRTPLNAVLGFAQLLLTASEPALRERQRAQVEAIAQAGWHLLDLINDVLDVARIEAGQLQLQTQALALEQLLDESLELLAPQIAAQRIRLQRDLSGPPLPLLEADPVRLRQALVNLLSNAVKYNRPGGVLSITAERHADHLALHIADTGIGMSEQQLAHLYEPFNRLGRERESIEGTGIGLVLTRYLLGLMGAELKLESLQGEGTVAHLRLPLARQAALPQDPRPEAVPTALPGGRLLYIEDMAVNRLLVQQMLADWPGLSLHMAEDGAQGLRLAAELRPDLLLLDMRLPDMHGIELLRRLRADPACAGLRVVALSANAMPEEVARALAAGAEDYWTKPLQLQRFRADLHRLLLRTSG